MRYGTCFLALLLLFGVNARAQGAFRHADSVREWSFPRDHGAHPGYGTEWWYFTGSLIDTENFHYGYELTFFRVALRPDRTASSSPWRASDLLLAHFTVTEVDWDRFHQRETLQRAAAGMAGADTTRLDVWIGDWRASEENGVFRLRAGDDALSIDLELRTDRAPVLHGEEGLSRKNERGDQASYYYSQPRMMTSGQLVLDGHPRHVSGMTWMDQEFFTGATPREGLGWDWFSVRLADGRDLMLYRVREGDRIEKPFGTAVEHDGSSRGLSTDGATFDPKRWWESPDTGARYPIEWVLSLPAEDLVLQVTPVIDAQEVLAEQTVGFAYWEGLCRYEGTWKDQPIEGEGYVELTGYEASPR